MGSYTNFMMGVICHIVKKTPSLFSVRMRLASEGYFRSLDEIRNSTDVQSSEYIAQYSLLFPHYDWTFTGIRHLQPLSMSDAVKAVRWGESNSIWKKNRVEINPTASREVSLDRLFFRASLMVRRYRKIGALMLIVNGLHTVSCLWLSLKVAITFYLHTGI
ncbi:hypothetical protein [Pseudomonas triticifolii]|uniref:Uncharacterized protein n=1 Tax=Pseudomonas triticifolii TaxID=2762592 RepID=A0ABR7BJ02_9PSED|nr:hypothetical protein [Pseudomonas triticifolii]MBC3957176.1 hypothetical protein [Pseudomonas triticifolii]